jgi:protein-ribulosamine 3-kinase
MPVPPSLIEIASEALLQAGQASTIRRVEPMKGGFTSQAFRLSTASSSYLFKWNHGQLPGLFTGEREGLALLRESGVLRVPDVLAAADATDSSPGFVLEEWIGHRSTDAHLRRVGSRLGSRIAELHRWSRAAGSPVPGYGLSYDGQFWGEAQPQGWDSDWVRFYRERRLGPKVRRARQQGLIPPDLHSRLEVLMDRLADWLDGTDRQPSLLHGDLWRGNVVTDAQGEPALVDPCAYFGDREMELTYTEVFGQFPPAFYAAYNEVWPMAPGYAERRDLYSLYYHLDRLGVDHFHDPTPRIESIARWYIGPR